MGPASLSLLILLTVLALASLITVVAGWRRIGRSVPLRLIAFVVTLVLTIAAGVVAVNREFSVYPTWGALFGSADQGLQTRGAVAGSLDKVAEQAAGGRIRSVVISVTITGARSGLALPGAVYVPAAYLDPASKAKQFPVIEVLSPAYGSGIDFYTNYMQLPAVADQEIAAGRMPPALIVIPTQNPVAGKDSECVNEVNGPQVDTYLSTDLREFMTSSFRVRPARQAWVTMGYSTGGYCAVNLVLRHADRYVAAASFSGEPTLPRLDATTGDLFKGSEQAKRENDPLWIVQHHKNLPPLYFWLYAAKDDHDPMRTSSAFVKAVQPPLEAKLVTRDSGGHGPAHPKALLPAALGWLGSHLVGPIAPPREP